MCTEPSSELTQFLSCVTDVEITHWGAEAVVHCTYLDEGERERSALLRRGRGCPRLRTARC